MAAPPRSQSATDAASPVQLGRRRGRRADGGPAGAPSLRALPPRRRATAALPPRRRGHTREIRFCERGLGAQRGTLDQSRIARRQPLVRFASSFAGGADDEHARTRDAGVAMRWAAGLVSVLAAVVAVVPGGCQKAAPRAEPPPPKLTVAAPQAREIVEADDYNGERSPVPARCGSRAGAGTYRQGQLYRRRHGAEGSGAF